MAGSLLALSWWFFPEYQKPCHVQLLAQVVHFEVDSTEWLKRWVSSAIGEDVQVWPALALPGWYIERKGKSDVLLYNGKNPNSLVRVQGKGVLTDNQIKRINHQFEQRCRDVEPVAYRKEKKEASRG